MLLVREENNQLTHEVFVVVAVAAAVTANHDHVLECEIATQVAETEYQGYMVEQQG